MTDELFVLRDVDRRLEQVGIPYMLTGSMAMFYYAEPRMTRDLDLVVGLRLADVEPLVESFQADYYVDAKSVREAVRRRAIFNVIRQDRIVKVDCIVRKETPYRREEFERRRRIDVNGFEVWIVSKEDLILSKLDWGLPRMRDTSAEFEELYHELLMECSGAERMRMGAEMFETAKQIVLASLPDDLTESEKRVQVFLRIYGSDFDPDTRDRIIEHLVETV